MIFGTGQTIQDNNTKKPRNPPEKIDLTFPKTVNAAFLRGLYNNTEPGYRLGAQLCRPPIDVPLAFMGFPHHDISDWDLVDNEKFWQERFVFYNKYYLTTKQTIQFMCHLYGTIGIFPWFDSSAGFVRWKFIRPEYVPDDGVIMDPETEEITGIITDIQYCFLAENGKQYIYREKRQYSERRIVTRRTGDIPPGMRSEVIRNNPSGILPVFFRNNAEPGEFEGHSDLQRIIPHVKGYSQINQTAHEELGNNRTKLVQYTADDVNKWAVNNGFADEDGKLDPSKINIQDIDLILNLYDKEKSEFIIPVGIVDNHIRLLEVDFKNIYQGSGLPEMLWGGKITGNHATASEQMGVLLSFVNKKQNQADQPYGVLVNATMQLEAMANNQTKPEGIINVWNDLDSLTELERSQIFDNYASGLQKLIDSNSIDLQSTHKILYELTNGLITSDYDDFKKQVLEFGSIRAALEQDYNDLRLAVPLEGDVRTNQAKSEGEQRNGKKSKDLDSLKEI
jgi:hypothetical protein